MQVVQTPSPWAIVASRWTCRPRTLPIASVSASHSWGNSWATWATGQCCWQSCSPIGELADAGGVALVGEHLGQRLGGRELGVGGADVGVAGLDEADPAAGEVHDGLLALVSARKRERLHGEVVVLVVEAGRDRLSVSAEDAGRAAASAGAVDALLGGLDGALLDQVVEVAAYGGRRQVEALGQVGGRGGAVLEDRLHHPRARRSVPLGDGDGRPGELHNTIVTLMLRRASSKAHLTCP